MRDILLVGTGTHLVVGTVINYTYVGLSLKFHLILADYRGGGPHPYQASPQQGMYMIQQIAARERERLSA
jgi:hypothetical protein